MATNEPDETARQDPPPVPEGDPDRTAWSATVPAGPTGTGHADPTLADLPDDVPASEADEPADLDGPDDPAPRSRSRDVLLGLGGVLVGFFLAFLIVALTTSGADGDRDDLAAALDQAERDLAEVEARNIELDAQLAEAEAAAGERDDDLQARRDALDERSGALDDREALVADREAAVAAREEAVSAREQALEDAGQPVPEPEGPGEPSGPPIDLPEIDTEQVENAVERVLDWLRGLFR